MMFDWHKVYARVISLYVSVNVAISSSIAFSSCLDHLYYTANQPIKHPSHEMIVTYVSLSFKTNGTQLIWMQSLQLHE